MIVPKNFCALIFAGLVLLHAGCGSSSDEFYRLSAAAAARRSASSGLSVGVGPVSLPSYLDRAELVYQNGPNEFQVPSNVRWAGSLRENITSVLALDFAQSLSVKEVQSYPWPAGRAPRYQVTVEIRQFHGISGSDAILDISSRIEDRVSGQTFARQSATFREPVNGDGYAAVVAAESRLLEQFAAAIAQSFARR